MVFWPVGRQGGAKEGAITALISRKHALPCHDLQGCHDLPQSFVEDAPPRPSPTMRTTPLYCTLLLLICGAFVLFATLRGTSDLPDAILPNHDAFLPPKQHDQSQSHSRFPASDSGWQFKYKRDGRNYGLSEDHCKIAFPGLFKEIDRAVKYRKDVIGNITPDELEVAWRGDGIVRAMIHENQLYIIDPHAVTDHNHRPRTLATLNAIQRALTAYSGELPDVEFSFSVHDHATGEGNGNRTTWAYTRRAHEEKLWLVPDFGLFAWPDVGLRSYAELQRILDHEEEDFLDKIPKLVWRGSLAVGSRDVRSGLVEQTKDKDWADVQELDWSNKTNIQTRLLTMQDHCSYMFVAQTEGNSYSGRLKYLLNCHSVLFAHKMNWIELYHHLMISSGPEQNYIATNRDYSDLPRKMETLRDSEHIQQAQRIADNARKTFRERYLTPAAEACYWRALIRGWASVQDFTPEFWEDVEVFDKVTQKKKVKSRPRGAPFESYAIMEQVKWELPAKPRKICIAK